MGYSRSRARCIPLQYQSSVTHGIKQALSNKQSVNQNLTLVSMPLQEKENITIQALNILSKESTGQVSQSEKGMFYELSNRKRMECEKYQDCSWFHQNPMKSGCNNKLSLAESFNPFTDADEFDLPMQFANPNSPWEDEYLELFSDDALLKENNKLEDKTKNFISKENFYSNYKEDEYDAFDSCNINFKLKKTDSMDSMKNILSTNPAEVIPISNKERLNNSSYELSKLGKVKNEIKNEIEWDSPGSNSYVMDSDEGDLNIGREEEVEEINSVNNLSTFSVKETISLDHVKYETDKVLPDYTLDQQSIKAKVDNFDDNNLKEPLLVKGEDNIGNNSTAKEKLDFNLDIPKLNFEQPLNVMTPDLDFMDLVDFINEEMRQENPNSTPDDKICQTCDTNKNILDENKSNEGNIIPSTSPSQTESHVNSVFPTTVDNSTVNFNNLSNPGVSIAERIKTSAKRRTRKSLKDFIDSEDEVSSESLYEDDDDDDDNDDDDDYDYRENIAKRRCVSARRRTNSSFNECSGDSKKIKDESSSYRERRNKNNEASRRSRQNRKARERHMYETLEEEEKRNVKLKAEADVLEKQVTSLRQLLLQVVLRKGSAT